MNRFAHPFVVCLVILFIGCSDEKQSAQRERIELRGVWLTNVDSRVLESRASISAAMDFLAANHFNIVFPVVWNKSYTLFPSAVMDSLFHTKIDTLYIGRDPLQELIEEAHKREIAVIPWFEFGFSSSYQQNGGRILKTKPAWAARDRDGRLLTKNGFEWMNPFHPEVQGLLLSLVLEVAKRYRVDGVQGDDRLPALPVEGDYSSYTKELYASEHGGASPPLDFREMRWLRWRAAKLNAFAQKLYTEVKAVNPDLLVSWAPSIFPWSLEEYQQDWPAWVNGGYADLVIPQVYRKTFDEYTKALGSQSPESVGISPQKKIVYPGILMKVGDYLISKNDLLAALAYNRAQGYQGETFFFYEGLRQNSNYLADVLRASVYAQPAKLPFEPAFLKRR